MEKYNTCFEALTQEFDFYDDEAEQILKALPELTENSYWNKYNQNIMQAIDIALYFGNTQESIVKYPKFIVTPPKSLLAKAALSILKKPDTSIVDTWTLSHSTFLTGVTATMNAILQGDLPNGYDIFTHTNESEKLLNLSKGEFVSKYRPQIQDYEYIMQNLKQYRPDTFEQLSSKFPDCFVNATTPVTISENHHNAEPVVEPSKKQNIEPGQMKSQQTLNVTQDIIDDNSKQDTLLINKLNDISEAQTVRQSIDTYSHICQKYNIGYCTFAICVV